MKRILLGFWILGLAAAPASAIEVDPMRLERSIPVQEASQGELTLSNPAGKAVGVRVSVGAYRAFQPGLVFSSAETWLTLEPSSFTLAPGASTTVHVRVQPPPSIAQDTAGEYLAAIVIDQLPVEPTTSSSTVTIVPRLAIPVYLRIQGREKIDVEISDLTASVSQAEAESTEGTPAPQLLRIDTVLKNHGTVHVRPVGTFALFDAQKGTFLRAAPLGRTLPLLPSASLKVPAFLLLPPAGKYRLTLTLESGSPEALQKEISFEITDDGKIVPEKP